MKILNQTILFLAFVISLLWSVNILISAKWILNSLFESFTHVLILITGILYILGIIGFISVFQKTYIQKPKLVIFLLISGIFSILLTFGLLNTEILKVFGEQFQLYILLLFPTLVQIQWCWKIKNKP